MMGLAGEVGGEESLYCIYLLWTNSFVISARIFCLALSHIACYPIGGYPGIQKWLLSRLREILMTKK
jgi:hypothetical protein